MTPSPFLQMPHATYETGIYRGLSYADYHAIPAINQTSLKGFGRSAAHAREWMLHPGEGSAAFAFGHAFHEYVLEPDNFARDYALGPDCNRRNKGGKAAWKAFEDSVPDRLALAFDEGRAMHFMREALMEHATARQLLAGRGASELTIVWRDEPTGLLCKARLDRVAELGEWTYVVDLKTTKDASPRAFGRDVGAYGYYRQLAWYRLGLDALRPQPRRAALVAVEKEAPWCAAVYELDERALEQGEREMRRYLDAYADCLSSGRWPGYDPEAVVLDLPAWLQDHVE